MPETESQLERNERLKKALLAALDEVLKSGWGKITIVVQVHRIETIDFSKALK